MSENYTVDGLLYTADEMVDKLFSDLAAAVTARDAALGLLREAAPKCGEQGKDGQMCGVVATWKRYSFPGYQDAYCCDLHRNASKYDWEPYDLGTHIAAALVGQPVADAEREALRAACAKARAMLWNQLPISKDSNPMPMDEFRRRTEDARRRGHPWPVAELIIEIDDALAVRS